MDKQGYSVPSINNRNQQHHNPKVITKPLLHGGAHAGERLAEFGEGIRECINHNASIASQDKSSILMFGVWNISSHSNLPEPAQNAC